MSARTPLYRQAQAAIKQLIVERGLRPGDPLPSEAELAETLGMSRLSLREGIKSLETMGVVTARHGDGLFVAPFSFAPLVENLPYGQYIGGGDLRHLLEVREALEASMASRLCEVVSAGDLERLAELAERMRDDPSDRQRIADLDQRFHVALMDPLRNPFVTDLVNVFWVMLRRLRDAAEFTPTPALDLRERHLAIVDALRTGDGPRAADAVIGHFAPLREQLASLD